MNANDRAIRAILRSPWAVHEAKLEEILGFLEAHAAGAQISQEEAQSQFGAARSTELRSVGQIAMIPVYGTIIPRANLLSAWSGGTSCQALAKNFDEALGNEDVSAIVLDIDSPIRDLPPGGISAAHGILAGGTAYRVLEEAELITGFVRERYRDDLQGFNIAVIFEEKLSPVLRRGRLGTAAKLPGKQRYLTALAAAKEGAPIDAVITLGFLDWTGLTDQDRQRLIHHELEHLVPNGEGGIMLQPHDFEDFTSIWTLYGPASESGRFSSDSIAGGIELVGSQLDLMEATG